MIDTIIFDFDGVIADSEDIWDKGQTEFLRRKGFEYNRATTKHLMTGKSLVDGVRVMQSIYGLSGNPKALALERKEIVKELYRTQLRPVHGFLVFYERIKKDYKTCIATSSDKELFKIADARFGFSGLFSQNIFFVEDVGGISKPAPDIFLYAARIMGSPPASCLVIEDAPSGIEAAKRAGMKCIALTTTYPRNMLASADVIVDSYEEIDLERF